MRFLELYCGECAMVCVFEQPPCQDGHDADCDEWVCTGCGGALLIASFPPVRVERRFTTVHPGGLTVHPGGLTVQRAA